MHPDVTAPGVDISSTCDSTGTVVGPCPPGENAAASGTSMASPHIAGAAAVLKQAQPALTPTQVRQALAGHGDPGAGRNRDRGAAVLGGRLRLRQPRQGRRARTTQRLAPTGLASRSAADRRVSRPTAAGRCAATSGPTTHRAPPSAASDTSTYKVAVGPSVDKLFVSLAHPSAGTVGANLFSYTVTVTDPRGKVVGTTTESPTAGSGTATASSTCARSGRRPAPTR